MDENSDNPFESPKAPIHLPLGARTKRRPKGRKSTGPIGFIVGHTLGLIAGLAALIGAQGTFAALKYSSRPFDGMSLAWHIALLVVGTIGMVWHLRWYRQRRH